MLAFESAWRVLMTEHAQIRELLDAIDRAVAAPSWRQPGHALEALRGLLERLKAFDSATHRPKGETLVRLLRGKSADTDARLSAHEQEQAECDRLLDEARALLGEMNRGRPATADEAAQLLGRHRRLLLDHLAREDTELRATAARWLTPEDCSAIVSSISSVVHPARRGNTAER